MTWWWGDGMILMMGWPDDQMWNDVMMGWGDETRWPVDRMTWLWDGGMTGWPDDWMTGSFADDWPSGMFISLENIHLCPCCSWRWRPRASRASLCGARCRGRVLAPPSPWSGHPSTSTSCSSSAYLYHYYYYLLLLLPFTLHHIAYFTSNTLYCQHYRTFRQNINETILS